MDAAKAMATLRRLDEQSRKKGAKYSLHPLSHFLVTAGFIIAALSFGKYELTALAAFLFYPLALILFHEIPVGLIAKRAVLALPALILLGIFNPLLDKNIFAIRSFSASAGWISFANLIFKGMLAVTAALLLICVTGIGGICSALYALHVPKLIVAQLSFTYRYIHLLGEEIIRVLSAYSLRSPEKRGVSLAQFGSLCGGLFLRSISRADTIYSAMRCRGFTGVMPLPEKSLSPADFFYILGWLAFFVIARLFNLSLILENLIVMVR